MILKRKKKKKIKIIVNLTKLSLLKIDYIADTPVTRLTAPY